jgi:hypothetical protein
MAAILHILKRDIRATWIYLCVIAAFLVYQMVELWQTMAPGNFEMPFSFSFRYSTIGAAVLSLIVIAITVRLIHEDSLVGTSAFWLTRPISRKSLLLAKGLYILLFLVIIPFSINFILLLHFGIKPSQVIPFSFTILVIQLTVICVFASLAAVTPNWPSFIAAALGAVIWQFVANDWLVIRNRPNEWISDTMLFGLLLLCLTFSIVVHQYLTRKTLRSSVLLISGYALVWLSCHFYIWDVFAPAPFRSHSSVASSVEIAPITKPDAIITYSSVRSFPLTRPIEGTLNLQNIPAREQIVLTHLAGKLEYPNGKRLSYSADNGVSYGVPGALQALLPGFEWIDTGIHPTRVAFLSVYEPTYKNLATVEGTYTGKAQFDIYQNAIISEAPLVSGNQINIDQNPVTIRDVENHPEIGNVVVHMESLGLTSEINNNDFKFCLLNRSRRQAFLLDPHSFSLDQSLILFGVRLVYQSWDPNFMVPLLNGRPISTIDNAWLAGANMVVIKRNFVGRLSRKFEIKSFRMADYSSDGIREQQGKIHP